MDKNINMSDLTDGILIIYNKRESKKPVINIAQQVPTKQSSLVI